MDCRNEFCFISGKVKTIICTTNRNIHLTDKSMLLTASQNNQNDPLNLAEIYLRITIMRNSYPKLFRVALIFTRKHP